MLEQMAELVLERRRYGCPVADTPAKIKDAWAARSSFLEAIMHETKLLDECDVVVPVNKIADYLDFVNKTGEDCGLVIKSFGHAGDGNLHIYQCSNDLEEEEFKSRVDKFFEIIYKEATNCGGLVSGRARNRLRQDQIPGRFPSERPTWLSWKASSASSIRR